MTTQDCFLEEFKRQLSRFTPETILDHPRSKEFSECHERDQ